MASGQIRYLDWIELKYHRLVATMIEERLVHTPATVTRNRKPLAEPASFGATWKLRFGPKNSFRVFYDSDLFTDPFPSRRIQGF
jgi:hypothetical protein